MEIILVLFIIIANLKFYRKMVIGGLFGLPLVINNISILLCWGICSINTSITTINLPLSYTTTYFVFLQPTYHKTNLGNLVTSSENTGTKKLSSFQARTNTQHTSDWFTIGY